MKIMHFILSSIVVLAFVGGASVGFVRAAQFTPSMTMGGVPCDMAMSVSSVTKPMAPREGMTPDCMKLTGCATISGLPVGISTHTFAVRYSVIIYPVFLLKLDGLEHQPEPFPPKSA